MRHTVAVLLLLSGCSGILGPQDILPPDTLPVEFTTAPLETEFAIETAPGTIVIRDRTMTGVCHRREHRGAHRDGQQLILWFAHVGTVSGPCVDLGKLSAYEARIRNLEPGDYRVRVQYIGHIGSNTYPAPVLVQEVEIR